jgi:hypothetical protein
MPGLTKGTSDKRQCTIFMSHTQATHCNPERALLYVQGTNQATVCQSDLLRGAPVHVLSCRSLLAARRWRYTERTRMPSCGRFGCKHAHGWCSIPCSPDAGLQFEHALQACHGKRCRLHHQHVLSDAGDKHAPACRFREPGAVILTAITSHLWNSRVRRWAPVLDRCMPAAFFDVLPTRRTAMATRSCARGII